MTTLVASVAGAAFLSLLPLQVVAVTATCSNCSGTATQRGATWCELNPLSLKLAVEPGVKQASFGCVWGAQYPRQQDPANCCPYDTWMSITASKTWPSPASRELQLAFPYYFDREPMLYDGQRKQLWDREYPECMEEWVGSSALLEIRGDGEESMWFAWGSNTSLEFAPSWGGGVRHYIGHRPMVAKAFQAGKLQAIVRAEDGTVFVLQSYLTQKKDVSGNWISMFPGSSTDPGEDADVCAYFASCCSSLPATWQAQCGYLASTVACGVSTCSGNVTLDDQRGEWCEVQAGDTPDVCSGTYGEPTCGCPGTPPCSEYGSGVRRLTKSDTPWPASGHFDIQIVA
eukprot:TRINITY_DN8322_c0_g1_i3.p1 TRINITY_DN8322_c0_g1~~TRINITY_DN8322_c0_g1_i3.p1  ORF type:complete len:343 (-),score=26.70 TRINITY_DN8322_c0_g1_i3:223-1251(-)